MKIQNIFLLFFLSITAIQLNYAQDSDEKGLGLPGDNLDLYATLDLFQNSKTIEDFEKALNKEDTGINNLDLDLDGEVDFIKVTTEQDDDDFIFKLQIDTAKEEVQDVAAIFVSKDKDGKVSLQMAGNEDLYGKDYVIEPKTKKEAVTANPAYSGDDTTVVESQPAQVVVVEQEPIVKYIYSPVYVPYYSPFYWGYYPPYWRPYPVISFSIYWGRHTYYRNNYYGGYRGGGNTVIINNNRTYNNYRSSSRTSNTVRSNKSNGNYTRNRSNTTTRSNNRASNSNRSNRVSNNRANTKSSNNRSTTTRNRSTSSSSRNSSFYNNRTNTSSSRNRSYSRSSSASRGSMNRSNTRPMSRPSSFGRGRR
jgi:hypothetical protein